MNEEAKVCQAKSKEEFYTEKQVDRIKKDIRTQMEIELKETHKTIFELQKENDFLKEVVKRVLNLSN